MAQCSCFSSNITSCYLIFDMVAVFMVVKIFYYGLLVTTVEMEASVQHIVIAS